MMVIDNKYNLGDYVYLKTDCDQLVRIVTAISVRDNYISYELSCGDRSSYHTEQEISVDKNVLITTSN